MLLNEAHVTKYKCVRDSQPFTLDKDVTCLVGKNEAGKTALLEALHKLNPVTGEGVFDVVKEYWRPHMLEYQNRHASAPETAVSTTWTLEPDDVKALEPLIGSAASSIGDIKFYKRFDNKWFMEFDLDENEVVQALLRSSELEKKEHAKYKAAPTVAELVSQLSAVPEEQKQRTDLVKALKGKFGEKSVKDVVNSAIWQRMPKIAYFSQYLRLPGQLSVDHFRQRVANSALKDEDRVFMSLLDMISMSVDSFLQITTYEDLVARLEAASGKLTRELRSFWPDGKYLRMDFKFNDALPGDPAPFNSGKIFRARIMNERYDVTTAFDQRSSGFIWFFSFLVWFTQLQKNYKGSLVVLLDEPGMSLHGTAQKELLKFIDQRIAPEHQVIYTTHSPFMIDPSNVARSRPVKDVFIEPKSGENVTEANLVGTTVYEKWWTADALTLFPLRGCLAYELTQTLFVGEHNLLVEGPADLMFIDWFKRKLSALKRPTLDNRWVVSPCGSLSKIGAFLNLFGGNHLHCAVFCDYAEGGKGQFRSVGESAALAAAEVYSADEFTNKPEADVEDMLGDEFYAALVNGCYKLTGKNQFTPPTAEDGKPTGRILKAAEAHMRTMPPDIEEFTHPGPADYLLRQGIEATYPGMDAALDRFQALFEKLNQNLEAAKGTMPKAK